MKRPRAVALLIELIFVGVTVALVVAFPWKSTFIDMQTRLINWLRQAAPVARILPAPQPENLEPAPTETEVFTALKQIREENSLSVFAENMVLHKLSRLLALEVEDAGELSQSPSAKDILKTLSPTSPQRLETLLFFIPLGSPFDAYQELASNSAVLEPGYRHAGVATRSAQISGETGTLLLISLSTPFQQAVAPATRPTTVRPTFTGQDLWAAVQDYRSAHALPLLSMSTELCTVASIRVNELLELGKLDNHAGFQAQSDAFFERHPDWTAINENLAAGYQTAVQTVEWGWDQSLGHQALIKSREFPYGCTAANSGFSVLITGK